ncbi:uncharacterized protein LOC142163419 [Nicotiana tabacum]|uniref:Uncharacterized protein LOC142163419 n=1 Tax=Nicotiana tabacum TaxID=4097 RepID=A0AC58RVP7_TOBAC
MKSAGVSIAIVLQQQQSHNDEGITINRFKILEECVPSTSKRDGSMIDHTLKPIARTWNIRGMNKPYKQKELRFFRQKNKIDIFGCLETRVKERRAKSIVTKVDRDWGYCCNYTKAIKGRIWLFWKTHLIVKILQIHEQFIHCSLEVQTTNSLIMLTTIYARNKVQERASLWHELQILCGQIQIPWLISRDFNNVLTTEDILGQPVTANEVHDFNWTLTYRHLEANFVEPGVSDHSPIVVQLWKRKTIYPRPFKLYMVTMDHKDFTPMVNRVWQQQVEHDLMELIWLKLKRLKEEAKGLNKAMSSYEQTLTQIRNSLKCVQVALVTDPFNQLLIEQEKQNMSDLEKWSTIEERILRQKSRATWIDYGDSNSKYFYAQLKIRVNKNNITFVYNDLGINITNPKAVEKEFTDFFIKLMGNANGLMSCPNTSIIKAGNYLTLQYQHELIMDITHEEIDEAIRDMP